MKKQILIITIFAVVLIFIGAKANAQAIDLHYLDAATVHCPTPTPLGSCVEDSELSPIPGTTYTYEISVNPAITTGNIKWFVYNATANGGNIITGGSLTSAFEPNDGTSPFLEQATVAVYNQTTGNSTASIDISWKPFNGLTTQILLIAYVEGDVCADNIEVWRIEPPFYFTLDIVSIMPDGTIDYGTDFANANECISEVQGAVYDGTNLSMDYGDNYVFFVVNAANFIHSWQPTFTVDNHTETAVGVADVSWAYPADAIVTGGTWNAATAPVLAQDPTGSVGADGECIIVRVYLDHANAENDANAPRYIIIGVDGIMYNVPTTDYSNPDLADLDPGTTVPCTNTETDEARYDLVPRPEIIEVTPAPASFVPKN